MKNIFKGLGLGLLALALVVGAMPGSAGASFTIGANVLTETGALTITGAVGSAMGFATTATTGDITIGNASQVGGSTIIYGGTDTGVGVAAGLSLTPGTAGTVVIGAVAGTGAIDVGTSTGAQTVVIGGGASGIKTINIVPTGATGNIVNVATGAVAATVTIGNVTGVTAVNINAGTGASTFATTTTGTLVVGGAASTGALTFGASTGAGQTVNIGSGATGGSDIVNIGTGTAVTMKTVNVGAVGSVAAPSTIHIADTSNTAVQLVTIGSLAAAANVTAIQGGNGTGAITLTPVGAGTIVIGAAAGTGAITLGSSSTTQTVNVGTGAGVATVNIGTGTAANVINIGTGGTGAQVITIGSATAGPRIYFQNSAPAGATTVTAAQTGSVFFVGAAGDVFTLPAPAAGLNYRFIVDALYITTPMTIVTTSSANIFQGNVLSAATAVVCVAKDSIAIVETAESLGDWVQVYSDGTSWFVQGQAAVTGALTCPLIS